MKFNLRKKFFAWMLKKGDTFSHKLYGSYKKELFKNIQGLVVEIGPGTGVNFEYFPSHINWIGIEPNEIFHEILQQQAKQREIQSQILKSEALHIPLPENSADFFLSTLVLCSVHAPAHVIAEIKRVLKPGGKFLFMEHVAAPKHTNLRRAQNIFNPVNRFFADGCNCNRETWGYIEQGGFSELQLSHVKVNGNFRLHSPHIMGYAVK